MGPKSCGVIKTSRFIVAMFQGRLKLAKYVGEPNFGLGATDRWLFQTSRMQVAEHLFCDVFEKLEDAGFMDRLISRRSHASSQDASRRSQANSGVSRSGLITRMTVTNRRPLKCYI